MNLLTANRLQQLRKMNGYSQDVLAEKLGVSRQSISKWERAEASPDTDNLIALAQVYGLSLDELLDTSKDVVKISTSKNKKDYGSKLKSLLSKANDFGLYPNAARAMFKFPFPVFLIIIYIVLSFVTKMWHPLWIMFLTIPVYYRIAIALKAQNKKALALLLPFPEIMLIAFLILGLCFGLWNSWILFLFIPIYYWLAACVKSK
uniref:helix-turn-helix domain-containing protein n=1 Tax=Eubacterium sp. TaxID=142586 RepID=UPI00402A0A2A